MRVEDIGFGFKMASDTKHCFVIRSTLPMPKLNLFLKVALMMLKGVMVPATNFSS